MSTKKKRPSDEELDNLVIQGSFGSARKPEDMPSTDPIQPTPMIVAVDEIDIYDQNPRQSENEMYEEIKASIAASGMDQTLTITRRPGAERYMIAAGGNTRLAAIKELWDETKDERFSAIHVLFKPWDSDTTTLVSHLKENDVRGDLIFFDRAMALIHLKAMVEETNKGKRLSSRKFSDELTKFGYTISRAVLDSVEYTHATLSTSIPQALAAGMGRRQVDRIRKLHNGFRSSWEELEIPAPEMGESQFMELLSRHDGDMIDEDLLRQDIINELAVSSDRDTQYVSMIYGAALNGSNSGALSDSKKVTARAEPGAGITEKDPAPTPKQADSQQGDLSKDLLSQGELSSINDNENDNDNKGGDGQTTASSIQGSLDQDKLDEEGLRMMLRTLAVQAAELLGCREIIRHNPTGAGFLVAPIPREIALAIPQEKRPFIAALWWSLAVVSEQFAIDSSSRSLIVPADWENKPIGNAMSEQYFDAWLMRVLQENDMEAQSDIPHMSITDLSSRGLCKMDDDFFEIWVEMVRTMRKLHKAADGAHWI